MVLKPFLDYADREVLGEATRWQKLRFLLISEALAWLFQRRRG